MVVARPRRGDSRVCGDALALPRCAWVNGPFPQRRSAPSGPHQNPGPVRDHPQRGSSPALAPTPGPRPLRPDMSFAAHAPCGLLQTDNMTARPSRRPSPSTRRRERPKREDGVGRINARHAGKKDDPHDVERARLGQTLSQDRVIARARRTNPLPAMCSRSEAVYGGREWRSTVAARLDAFKPRSRR